MPDDDNTPVYDTDEVFNFIWLRLVEQGLANDENREFVTKVMEAVLVAEEEYMVEKGIIPQDDEDPEA